MTKPSADSREPRGSALFLAPEAPYPPVGGGPLRSASLFEYLARRYHVDAIVFRQPGEPDPRARFPRGVARSVEVIDLAENSRNTLARAARNGSRLLRRVPPLLDRFAGHGARLAGILKDRRYDVGVVEHFWCAPYLEQIAPACRATVLDMHNVESLLHARCAATEPFGPARFAHRLFASASEALERRWLPRYSWLLAASPEDRAAIRRIAPSARVHVYPNTLPLVPQPGRKAREMVVFSGNLEYHPNVSAVRYFAREIWPWLREERPRLVWRLVGKNPDAVLRYTSGDARIECSGPVRDAVAELADASVAVVPLLAGSGTRLKILEAWAAGVPVVSTALGAEGLPARHEANILLADGARSFRDAVRRLLDCSAMRDRIGRAGRATYERDCTWQAAWAGLICAGYL